LTIYKIHENLSPRQLVGHEPNIRVVAAMTTIYLSSTYEDLKDYREVVYKALRKSGYNVIAMEDYVSTDQRPVDKCLKDVAGTDI